MNRFRGALADPVEIGCNCLIDIEQRQNGDGIGAPGTRSNGQQGEDYVTEEQLLQGNKRVNQG